MAVYKQIGNFAYEATGKQLNEIQDLTNREDFKNPRFQKFFYVWVAAGAGIFYFPKERYSALKGNEYVVALLKQMSLNVRKLS